MNYVAAFQGLASIFRGSPQTCADVGFRSTRAASGNGGAFSPNAECAPVEMAASELIGRLRKPMVYHLESITGSPKSE